MKINMKDYEEWKEKSRSERAEISKMDFYEACGRIASVAAEPEDKAIGILSASVEIVKAYRKLFPEKKEDKAAEEPQEEKNTKYDDLKNRIFNHAAGYILPVNTEVENHATAEIRRSAKYVALLLLIADAGLRDEYLEWMRENGYE